MTTGDARKRRLTRRVDLRNDAQTKAAMVARTQNRMVQVTRTSFVTPDSVEVKAGLVGSHSRVGQAAQAAVSTFIPGDLSPIRSPIRSGIARALTPGGGGDRNRGVGKRILRRCPPGFENGGKFANKTYTNCGARLFGPVGIRKFLAGAANGIGRRAVPTGGEVRGGRLVTPGEGGLPIISRDPNIDIPAAASWNGSKVERAIKASVGVVAAGPDDGSRLIRRDGYVLEGVADIERLARVRRSDDMEGGYIVSKVTKPEALGRFEIAAMSNTNMAGVVLALPGGSSIRLEKADPSDSGKVQNMVRHFSAAMRFETDGNYGAALAEVVKRANGKIRYSESFPNIDKPNDMVLIERDRKRMTVKRWVYETFMAEKAAGRPNGERPWKEIDSVGSANAEEVSSGTNVLKEAVEAINDTNKIDGVADGLLYDALMKADVERADIGGGRTRFELKNGDTYTVVSGSLAENLSRKVTADLFSALKVNTPSVRYASADRRRVLEADVRDVYKGAKFDQALSIADGKPEDLAKIMLADFLVDNQRRGAGSLMPVRSGKAVELVPFSHDATFGEGKVRDLADYMTKHQSWGQSMMARYLNIRRSLIMEVFDDLIEDAEGFDWEAYRARLAINGLSDIEKRQLERMKGLYASRVKMLRASRKSFLSALGVMR